MKKIDKIILLTILVIRVLLVENAIAIENTCKLTLNISSEVKPGGVVEQVIKVSNISAGDGIVGIEGNIKYDSNVFEKVELEECSGWANPFYTEGYFSIFTSTLEATKTNQDILKIKLTTKSTATEGNYEVKLTNISITTDNGSFNIDEVKSAVTIKTSVNNIVENKAENNEENINDNKKSNTFSGNNAISSNVSSHSLPKTGLAEYLVIGIVVVAVVGIILYLKYKKYNLIK